MFPLPASSLKGKTLKMPQFPDPAHLLIALLCAAGVALAARKVRALSVSGAWAACVIGFLLFGFGGGYGAIALLLFFVTSSGLSRLGKRRKEELAFEKGGERDAMQAIANGGVAAVCAALLPFFPGQAWVIAALLGSLAAANADTWATELGALAKGKPRMLTTFQPAPTGASGAISLPGTLAAFVGAALLCGVALLWGIGWHGGLAVTLGGFVGSLMDSYLGATVQAQYRCPTCGALTERTFHCQQATVLVRGLPWANNDVVNLAATLSGAIFSVLALAV